MRQELKLIRIGDLCKIQSGGTPSRTRNEYFEGDIPWAKISDLETSKDGFVYETDEYITKEGLSSINNRLFSAGTLLLAIYGSVGKVAFAGRELSTNQAILGIQAKPDDELDLKYLKHWFVSKKADLLHGARGVALKNLSATIVKDLKIPLPPLAEQQKIAAILDAADSLRQKDRQLIDHYTTLSQSLFLEMFGDPVANPMGWEQIELGTLGKISSGSTPSRDVEQNYHGNIPWVKTGEVKGTDITKTSECISEDALANSSCKLFPSGSLIIAMYGQGKTRGQVGRLRVKAATNQACAVIPPSDRMDYDYLYMLLKLLYEDLRRLGRGGNQPNLNSGLIKSYSVIAPPIALQNQFAERIKVIEAQKQQAQASLEKSEALFNSLLQRAFSGELTGALAA